MMYRLWVLCILFFSNQLLAAGPCIPLDPSSLNLLPGFSSLKKPGAYCLKGDVTQKGIRELVTGNRIQTRAALFFKFATEEATLDLSGFTVKSEEVSRPGIGVVAPYREKNGVGTDKIWDREFAFHSLRVTNGRLVMPGQAYNAIEIPRRILLVSLESDAEDRLVPRRYPLTDLTDDAFTEELNRIFQRDGMKHWGNSVDNLEIIAGRTAVNMSGINNAVRDSKIIVTDSLAGTYMFGPGTIIENNIFIFRGMARTESAAPIKLHFGDKATIRNNIFIVEDAELAPEQAISLIQSKKVTISGNRVFGNVALARKYDDQTSTVERDNIVMPLSERPFVGVNMRAADQVVLSRLARDEPQPKKDVEADTNF